MKKITVLLIIIVSALKSFSQLEVYGRYTAGKTDMDVNLYGEKKLFSDSSKFSFTYFALVEKTWAEGLVGISYSPKSWLSVGGMIGIEQNPALYRFLGSVWMGKGKTSLLALYEKGDGIGNYWYKITLGHDVTKKFSVAARAWRFNGIGPVLTLNVKKLSSSFWVMPAIDFEAQRQKRISLGISIKL